VSSIISVKQPCPCVGGSGMTFQDCNMKILSHYSRLKSAIAADDGWDGLGRGLGLLKPD
jgi:hypothetical protein